jgi:hypothetical protein
MKGLKSFTSWRTFLAGMIVGYVAAWGIHWATTFYMWGVPFHDHIPLITPVAPEAERQTNGRQ